jgi:hypothetical protein
MAGFRSSSNRDSGLRNGPRPGVSPSGSQIGRSDSRPVGKIRQHGRSDMGGANPGVAGGPGTAPVTPVGQSPGPIPDKIGGRF